MLRLTKGRYAARHAETAEEIAACQRLRHLSFVAGTGAVARSEGYDRDAFDTACHHIMVEERATGQLVCCFRILPLADGGEIAQSYSAQFYELSALESFEGPIIELAGRHVWQAGSIHASACESRGQILDGITNLMPVSCHT